VNSPANPSPEINWALIETEYKAGVVPVPTIAMKYQISVYRIEREAKLRNWKRLPPPDLEEVVGTAEHYDLEALRIFDPEFLRQAALMSAATIVNLHREDIAKLRGNEQLILERLTMYLAGAPVSLPFKVDRESPSDILNKLASVMYRRIEMERQAYGLSSFNPNAKDPEDQISDQVRELLAKIDAVAAGKAKMIEGDKP
jgi:hypothetical protein